eukprot:Rmarinus@m.23163
MIDSITLSPTATARSLQPSCLIMLATEVLCLCQRQMGILASCSMKRCRPHMRFLCMWMAFLQRAYRSMCMHALVPPHTHSSRPVMLSLSPRLWRGSHCLLRPLRSGLRRSEGTYLLKAGMASRAGANLLRMRHLSSRPMTPLRRQHSAMGVV